MSETKYERLSTNPGNSSKNDDEEIEMQNETHLETHLRKPIISKSIIHLAIGTLGLIFLYLSLSICLTFYQGRLLKNTKYPFSIVSYHLIIKFLLCICVRQMYKLLSGKSRVCLDWRTSVKRIAPIGVASGIDIGFSNWGLELVKISLYTMTKSTTIIFILILAIMLGLEKKSWSLVFIVVMISGGLSMFTYKSTQFDAFGFAFLLFASFTSGIRWSFAQLIMQKSKLGLHHPIDMIYHMQPWMFISVLPFTIIIEGKGLWEIINNIPTTPYESILILILKVTIGAVLAFLMEISEFLVLGHTSSLTLSIAGVFKDICQIVLAVELDGDELSLINILGLALCLGGICCHVIHKYSLLRGKKSLDGTDKMNHRDLDNVIASGNNVAGPSSGGSSFHHHPHNSKNSIEQNVPLLNSNYLHSDSDEDSHDPDGQSSSELIFDVLKRRDITTIRR